MKRISYLFLCFGIILLNTGCQNTKTRAVEGGVIGGLLGAAAGGIIGHQSGHGGQGAAIGLAAGAATGALAGSQIEKPDAQQTGQATAQVTNSNQLTMQQIVDLTRQNVNEDEIISRIQLTNSKFILSASDISFLKQQGVSQKVIDAMQVK